MMRSLHGLIVVVGALVLAAVLTTPVLAQVSEAPDVDAVTSRTGPSNALGNRSRSDIWFRIRQGAKGTVSLPDGQAGVLIQSEGELWRAWRNGPVSYYGAMVLLTVLAILAVYFAVRGRIRIKAGRSGKVVARFSLAQRIAHWFVACLFVLLGMSGLIILFGRYALLPLVGAIKAVILHSVPHGGDDWTISTKGYEATNFAVPSGKALKEPEPTAWFQPAPTAA